MTPEEILEEAAKWLAEHDWCQDVLALEMDDKVISACAIGAIRQVTEDIDLDIAAIDLLAEYLEPQCRSQHPESNVHPIAWWNDLPERTVEDVILAMKSAARHESL